MVWKLANGSCFCIEWKTLPNWKPLAKTLLWHKLSRLQKPSCPPLLSEGFGSNEPKWNRPYENNEKSNETAPIQYSAILSFRIFFFSKNCLNSYLLFECIYFVVRVNQPKMNGSTYHTFAVFMNALTKIYLLKKVTSFIDKRQNQYHVAQNEWISDTVLWNHIFVHCTAQSSRMPE